MHPDRGPGARESRIPQRQRNNERNRLQYQVPLQEHNPESDRQPVDARDGSLRYDGGDGWQQSPVQAALAFMLHDALKCAGHVAVLASRICSQPGPDHLQQIELIIKQMAAVRSDRYPEVSLTARSYSAHSQILLFQSGEH